MSLGRIRNFSIIAHIDHGKSTLADRILEHTGLMGDRNRVAQVLDDMDLERERGITIKARAVEIPFASANGSFQLNLIDTPGHVDFAYEVERSLQACEGAVLLVDAAQGVQAQTVANAEAAQKLGLKLIPVLNKIDLPTARPDEIAEELHNCILLDDEPLTISAKTGAGVAELLERIVEKVPPPEGDRAAPFRARVFDSVHDDYRGVIVYIRAIDGSLARRDRITLHYGGTDHEVLELGKFRPHMVPCDRLEAGEVGYVIANIKTLSEVVVGDTMLHRGSDAAHPLPAPERPKPMVFTGLYPVSAADFTRLRQALERLSLNDASFTWEPESSDALGFGFRCGFLGLLHMEIVQERLEREEGVDVVQTAPTVTYRVQIRDGEEVEIHAAGDWPDPATIEEVREPIVRAGIIVPVETMGSVIGLCLDRRGSHVRTDTLSATRVEVFVDMPLSGILYDFYDRLKSGTRGYGTLDYEVTGWQSAALVKMRILVNGEDVDALSTIIHRDEAESAGRAIVKKLKQEIPRHLFAVPIQAAVGGKIVARETVQGMGKNVTAKCYGGDITRKRKLLEKQKAGKKRMRQVGSVTIPQKAFLSVLSREEK